MTRPNLAQDSMSGEWFFLKDAVWNLTNKQTMERTAQAFLRVSDDDMSYKLSKSGKLPSELIIMKLSFMPTNS